MAVVRYRAVADDHAAARLADAFTSIRCMHLRGHQWQVLNVGHIGRAGHAAGHPNAATIPWVRRAAHQVKLLEAVFSASALNEPPYSTTAEGELFYFRSGPSKH